MSVGRQQEVGKAQKSRGPGLAHGWCIALDGDRSYKST
ncbi:MAG: hypothetical protein GFH27_549291n312 [Chloroflexi bacterium AL-W]|nr:hypothetical protein [Chloroflexi bacterium AL-N1]NOK67220.1 hypothetical protein [Chloroflexi bacterium AL-N10]NOK75286.1 hypothetical protein [Chloroflexi bacterium AL-N5]NOK82074.1 hypothetical protein [Chloroflexi bacterium AL-W]NOK89919.1 hypothetical protein [Chloroflexi bacterium AL-N15]